MEDKSPVQAPPDAPLAGRYRLGAVLGSGGMGEVRAAWDLKLERQVAVKLLRHDVTAIPGVRQRFEQEARTAARLVHPHVVTVFDTGEDGGVAFLVMEQLPGWTLADTIDREALGSDRVRTLGLQVLDALAAAHQMGLIHRDIKPTNLLGASTDRWKVGDFGIAKSVEATDPGLTSTGMVIGTPAYLAPERRAGAAATPSTDLYAVGVVLLEAVLGRRGGPGDASPDGLRRRLAQVEPPALRALLERATSDDPAERHGSADAMAEELRAWDPTATGGPVGYGVTEVLGAVGDTAFDAGAEGRPSAATGRPPSAATRVLGGTEKLPSGFDRPSGLRTVSGHALLRSRPWQVLAAVIALVLIVTVVALAGQGGGPTPPRTSPPPSVPTPAVSPTSPSSLPPGLDAGLRRLQQAVQP